MWFAGAAQFGIAFTFSVCGSAIERGVGAEISELHVLIQDLTPIPRFPDSQTARETAALVPPGIASCYDASGLILRVIVVRIQHPHDNRTEALSPSYPAD